MTLLAALCGWLLAVVVTAWVVALRARLELVARAEHELRGPLTALSLARGAPDLAAAVDSQLERVFCALGDLEAARHGRRAAARPEPVALSAVVAAAVSGWSPAARCAGRRIQVDMEACGGAGAVRADRGRVAQVLGNLLGNALEHGRGAILVRARRGSGRVLIEVRDGGAGIERGRGLSIASDAAADCGGRLVGLSADGGAAPALELPALDP